jgi:hypothetical protein
MTAPKKISFDRERLAAAAQACEGEMVHFLRDLVAIPAESSQEGPVIGRIQREMRKVGFDEIQAGFGRCGTLWGFEYYGVVPEIKTHVTKAIKGTRKNKTRQSAAYNRLGLCGNKLTCLSQNRCISRGGLAGFFHCAC